MGWVEQQEEDLAEGDGQGGGGSCVDNMEVIEVEVASTRWVCLQQSQGDRGCGEGTLSPRKSK